MGTSYNGQSAMKNFSFDQDGDDPEEDDESDGMVAVQCLCHGILCRRCKRNRILEPGSNVYDPESNSFEHIPYFAAMMPCSECRAKERTP